MKHRTFVAFVCSSAIILGLFAGCSTPPATVGTGESFKGPLGLQLYSLRKAFSQDVPGTLAQVKNFGFEYVETAGTYGMPPETFSAMLKSNGLHAVSAHFPYDRFKNDPEGVAREAKALGVEYAGTAWISHQPPFNEAAARDAIQVFNRAGEVLAKQGIKFFYHTHGYEFHPYKDGTLFDLLMAETNPEFVRYEMDVFWIVHPGQDPVKLLDKYGKRFELMHVKDMKKGTERNLTGKSDVNNDVAIGTGEMDWPAILAASKRAGVKWYFIEDEADEVARHIPHSLHYLKNVKF
jgi:sugar phosphate isomerase/epimerase